MTGKHRVTAQKHAKFSTLPVDGVYLAEVRGLVVSVSSVLFVGEFEVFLVSLEKYLCR